MQLPEALRRAIDQETEGLKLSSLSTATAQLSAAYRQSGASAMAREQDRLAYLVSRLPATYAATRAVLLEIRQRLPDLQVRSILDLGAGPGTASFAAVDVFPTARQITQVERDSSLVQLGERLAAKSESEALQAANWMTEDLTQLRSLERHDLVLLSYAIGELDAPAQANLLQLAWNAAASVLAIVEPGTPTAFSSVRGMRDTLIQNGAHIIAPCPHDGACPMPEPAATASPDWCHFAQRVERSSLHRRVKGGTLGYEDEKYSYIAVSRSPVELPPARIIRHPQHHSGFVELSLCAANGLCRETISRKTQSTFRRARKSSWGDSWEPAPKRGIE